MKRHLSLLLVLPLGLFAACSSKKGDDTNAPAPGTEPGTEPGTPGAPGTPGGPMATGDDLKKNPIQGIAPAKVTLDAGEFTDGPIWSAKEGVMFFTTPLGLGGLYRMRPDGATLKVREGDPITGVPIGNTIDKAGDLLTIEAKRIMRGSPAADAGAPSVVATGWEDPGAEAGAGTFDTLNDAVVSGNGTIYATDPGYFATPIANRIFRITPAGKVTVVEAFDDVPRPNGIALTPDGKGLYVGFSAPQQGTKPFVRKYYVNADGSLGEHAKFLDLDTDMQPDGIEVDQAGNLYIATKVGLQVFAADAKEIGLVPVPEWPTGAAFGGKDLKTLYITTQGLKIYEIQVNVPGIVQ